MEKGLRNNLKVYDDYIMLSPEELNRTIDEIDKIGCMSFVIDEANKEWENYFLNYGTNKKTTRRT